MVNILLRTSCRPKGYKRTIDFLRNQKDQDFKLFVSVDSKDTKKYVLDEKYPCTIVENRWIERKQQNHNPYNLYVNTLKAKTKKGWNIVIDDDDIIYDNMVETINKHCIDKDTIYIFKLDFMNRILPSDANWGKNIVFGDISSPCIVVNAKWKKLVDWKPVRGGDYKYILDLVNTRKLKIAWVDDKFYKIEKPGSGLRQDI